MDKELFNSLPYEKQEKIENMALRSMLLELQVKEWENDQRAYLTIRPMYKNPYGNEFRYYTDNYSVVQTCGKHLFASLQFTGHVSGHGSYSYDTFYDDFYFSVDLERATQMRNTLKWLDRRVREEAEEMYEYGSYSTFTEYITAVVFALGALGGIVRGENDERIELGLEDFLSKVSEVESNLLAKYADEPEKEVA